MYKKTVTYTDYDGNERTEDFYFHLTQAEVFEMQFSQDGGLDKQLEKLVRLHDYKKLVQFFKSIVLKAYGEKSDDGRRFVKSEELSKAFSETEAYSQIFMELASDSKSAEEFIENLPPKNLQDKYKALMSEKQNAIPFNSTVKQ